MTELQDCVSLQHDTEPSCKIWDARWPDQTEHWCASQSINISTLMKIQILGWVQCQSLHKAGALGQWSMEALPWAPGYSHTFMSAVTTIRFRVDTAILPMSRAPAASKATLLYLLVDDILQAVVEWTYLPDVSGCYMDCLKYLLRIPATGIPKSLHRCKSNLGCCCSPLQAAFQCESKHTELFWWVCMCKRDVEVMKLRCND